jgi:hypothetical protein
MSPEPRFRQVENQPNASCNGPRASRLALLRAGRRAVQVARISNNQRYPLNLKMIGHNQAFRWNMPLAADFEDHIRS